MAKKQYGSYESRAKSMIDGNNYMVTATSDGKNDVWAATVSYVCDKEYNFYFLSAIDSRHAENISKNPNIAFQIFDSTQGIGSSDGIQAEGEAELVEEAELPGVIELYVGKFFPESRMPPTQRYPPENYGGASEFRFFKVTVSALYITGGGISDQRAIAPNNERRVEIDLKKLSK